MFYLCSTGIGAVLCLCFPKRNNRFSQDAAFIAYYTCLQGLKIVSEAEWVAPNHPYQLSKRKKKEYLFSRADVELFTFRTYITFIKQLNLIIFLLIAVLLNIRSSVKCFRSLLLNESEICPDVNLKNVIKVKTHCEKNIIIRRNRLSLAIKDFFPISLFYSNSNISETSKSP